MKQKEKIVAHFRQPENVAEQWQTPQFCETGFHFYYGENTLAVLRISMVLGKMRFQAA